uniref:WIBG Mago-binding domain-containing protein n=1 Tax=Peronospora matthiolae TaxID=2874970 RepID=A0AAV1V4T7_9STRA
MNVADANELLPTGAIRSADGEVVVPASRRADGSLRKPIRIRKGYVPQEEVPKYKPVGQRRREQEAKAAVDATVDELSMDTLSLMEKREEAVVLRPRSSDKRLYKERGQSQEQLTKEKGGVTPPVETSGPSAGDDHQQLKRQLTRINQQLKEIAKLEGAERGALSRQEKQKVEKKVQLQQQSKEISAELNGATVTTSTTGPRPKISISL